MPSICIYNEMEMRYDATIADELIVPGMILLLVLPDEWKGKISMTALEPGSGTVKVWTNNVPPESITLYMSLYGVR